MIQSKHKAVLHRWKSRKSVPMEMLWVASITIKEYRVVWDTCDFLELLEYELQIKLDIMKSKGYHLLFTAIDCIQINSVPVGTYSMDLHCKWGSVLPFRPHSGDQIAVLIKNSILFFCSSCSCPPGGGVIMELARWVNVHRSHYI